MNNNDKYLEAFVDVFGVSSKEVPNLKYQQIKAWDSVGHMSLIALIEEKFNIMLDTEDIIDFSSFEIGKDILKKYNVEF